MKRRVLEGRIRYKYRQFGLTTTFVTVPVHDNARQKILITNDEIDYSTSTVRHISLKEFLESETL